MSKARRHSDSAAVELRLSSAARSGLRFLFLLAAAWLAFPSGGRAAAAAKLDGPALAQLVREQRPTEVFEASGLLRLRNPAGKWWKEVPVRLTVQPLPDGWQSHYVVYDAQGAPAEELLVIHQGSKPNRYVYRPPGGKVVALRGGEAAVSFAGSQFWLCDLGLEFLWWPKQRILGSEMRKGRPCRVLESVNPDPAPGQYGSVKSWIDAEKLALLRAEAYDASGKLLKEFNIGSVKKVRGQWRVKSMEIRDALSDARTRLEFDLIVQ